MSYRATHRRPGTSAPSDGSRTITITGAPPREEGDDDDAGAGGSNNINSGTLKLRGANRKTRQKVVWSDDVVDNEGCGRKSSKICCIYHKPRPFDESSSEEGSDSDTDSDSSCAGHGNNHNHGRRSSGRGGQGLQTRQGTGGVTQVDSDDSDDRRNAYEIAPSSKKDKNVAA